MSALQPQREHCASPLKVSSMAFREAMSHLAAAVNVVTTDGPGGRAGFTASAVCSVTDEPPTLLVCINQNASAYPAFTDNDTLCVNVLSADHQEISNTFGGRTPMTMRFDHAEWTIRETGAPVLADALAHFECRISQRVSVGTHEVMFCEIVSMATHDEQACLLYFDRQYRQLPRMTANAG